MWEHISKLFQNCKTLISLFPKWKSYNVKYQRNELVRKCSPLKVFIIKMDEKRIFNKQSWYWRVLNADIGSETLHLLYLIQRRKERKGKGHTHTSCIFYFASLKNFWRNTFFQCSKLCSILNSFLQTIQWILNKEESFDSGKFIKWENVECWSFSIFMIAAAEIIIRWPHCSLIILFHPESLEQASHSLQWQSAICNVIVNTVMDNINMDILLLVDNRKFLLLWYNPQSDFHTSPHQL